MIDLSEKLKKLPDKPGVYLMKNSQGEIIYVGKAKSLTRRVRQYFQKNRSKDKKVLTMVSHIDDFEYIIVDNEIESLVLESNLIKRYMPKYNILLRDDKQYPYIKVTVRETYPRLMKTREVLKDGSKYFGPYPSVTAVNDALEILRDLYPIRNCNRNLEGEKKYPRPCLNYFINRCIGPCIKSDLIEKYNDMIGEILIFLDGRDDILREIIGEKMLLASKELRFEEAAGYRDQLESLDYLKERQKIVSTTNLIDQDIIAMAKGIEEACVQVFFVRKGKIIGREHFLIEDSFKEEKSKILNSFVKQFYSGTAFIPKEILLETEIEESESIEGWLSKVKGSKVSIVVPKIGDKKKLIDMVKKNALDMIDKYGDRFLRKARENQRALEEISSALNLNIDLNRIEAYDISNIKGTNSVGSMVVFEKGEPKKSDYRRFKIHTVVGPDDYKSMEEILNRRFKRGLEEQKALKDKNLKNNGFSVFPDLIMMDGGRGQVNVALRVLKNLGIDIPVCGLVKDDFHNTRGIIYDNREIELKETSLGFRLIYRIQEEAHRFAISFHKSLRSKDLFRSELDGIKGIGQKRKKDLLSHFKSIEKIKSASIEELLEVTSMNTLAAEELYRHFRK